MATDWQMPRRSDACLTCAKPFAAGDEIWVLLNESATGYERRDLCPACNQPTEPPPLAMWRTRRPVPTAKPAAGFDRDAIFGFFQRMGASDEPAKIQFRFVLALLLWRKRVLKFASTEMEPTGEVWRFVTLRGDQTFDVLKPELDEDQIERLSAQLEELISGSVSEFAEQLEPAAAEIQP